MWRIGTSADSVRETLLSLAVGFLQLQGLVGLMDSLDLLWVGNCSNHLDLANSVIQHVSNIYEELFIFKSFTTLLCDNVHGNAMSSNVKVEKI